MTWRGPSKDERIDQIISYTSRLFIDIAKDEWWEDVQTIAEMSLRAAELDSMIRRLYNAETRCKKGHVTVPGSKLCTQCGALEKT